MVGKELRPLDPDDIPGFQTADTFECSQTEREAYEEKIRELEREKEERDSEEPEISVKVKQARPVLTSEEKQRWIVNIHDLKVEVKDLKNTLEDRDKEISSLRDELKALTKWIGETTKRVSDLEDKRDDNAFSELKTELFDFLSDKYREGGVNGVYVKDLYNKKAKKRKMVGILNISKSTASRLKIAIQMDPESKFKIAIYRGKEFIRLNSIK